MDLRPKPTPIEEVGTKVITSGPRGVVWSDFWIFQQKDVGHFRFELHSMSMAAVLIVIALHNSQAPSIHPINVVADYNRAWYVEYMGNRYSVLGPQIPRGRPVWLWVRFFHGVVQAGMGADFGEDMVLDIDLKTPNRGYERFGIGKLGQGGFELVNVHPMEAVHSRNIL